MSPEGAEEKLRIEAGFYPLQRFHDSRRLPLQRVPVRCANPAKIAALHAILLGTMRHRMNWEGLRIGREAVPSIAKEKPVRNRILGLAAIAAAISAPIAAQAQSDTVGIVRGNSVIIDNGDGIALDQRPAFREYVIRERVPTYTVPDRVIVGGVLPEAGITYYDVPQTYGPTTYRYTVVNGQTVLVEPRTRRVVQVVE
jgi:Protein of unknown function (DUF1236)